MAEAEETANDVVTLGEWSKYKASTKEFLKFATPPASMEDGEMADLMVYLRELKKLAEDREKVLSGILQHRHRDELNNLKSAYEEKGEKEYLAVKGDCTPGITFEYVVQQRLNTEALKTEFGEEWLEEHKSPTTFFQGKVNKV
jgi:hypothetical protein